jgi:hypothetical protein
MVISHPLRYVYIGIPRTGSKSMHRWLVDHYAGEWRGMHEWRVPAECQQYLVFTVVRNPYERAASGMFGVLWGDEEPDVSRSSRLTRSWTLGKAIRWLMRTRPFSTTSCMQGSTRRRSRLRFHDHQQVHQTSLAGPPRPRYQSCE